jgi:Short repeat of unknown function (DUF308)
MSDWWLLLITALLEIPLGVLALADPGATLAALSTVGGIWAVAIGVMRIVVAFQVKRLPARSTRPGRRPITTARHRAPSATRGGPPRRSRDQRPLPLTDRHRRPSGPARPLGRRRVGRTPNSGRLPDRG